MMSDLAIRVADLSKQYRIGSAKFGQDTLRDNLAAATASFLRAKARPVAEERSIWALRNVSFDVAPGEAIGIVGKNGAGKSTLLKILSRITEPTSGRAEIYGLLRSLLEVGTGFHRELTGRENVYLNGAVLGMRRAEIRRRFDEIVEFAEVGKFIDTPVKHYSTGMRVRLAFSVAAHLSPEILVVDEVLAVGDMAFQNKCLTKMREASAQGATIMFVSHNLAAVKMLCGRALWLSEGRVAMDGEVSDVAAAYVASLGTKQYKEVGDRTDREGDGRFRFTKIRFVDGAGTGVNQIPSGDELRIRLGYTTAGPMDGRRLVITVSFRDDEDRAVVTFSSDELGADFDPMGAVGEIELAIPSFLVRGGKFPVSLFARYGSGGDGELCDCVYYAASMEVTANDVWKTGCLVRPGPCALVPASIRVCEVGRDTSFTPR